MLKFYLFQFFSNTNICLINTANGGSTQVLLYSDIAFDVYNEIYANRR